MIKSLQTVSGFLASGLLSMGLLIFPHLLPPHWALCGLGLTWPVSIAVLALAGGLACLALTLWTAGKLIRDATTWLLLRVILGVLLIAVVANTLFSYLVELFALHSGWRALITLLGVPIIYGNLGAVLGKTTLRQSMLTIFTGVLTSLGVAYIAAAIFQNWR